MNIPEWEGPGAIDDAIALVMRAMLRPDTVMSGDQITIRLDDKEAEAFAALARLPLARRKGMYDHFRQTIYSPVVAGVITIFGTARTKAREDFMNSAYLEWIRTYMMFDLALGNPSMMDRVLGLAPDRESGK